MSPAFSAVSTIPPRAEISPNPLDVVVHNCGRKLLTLQMTRLVGEPDKGDAQDLTRDLLDIGRMVDEMILAIGRHAQSHFGRAVDLKQFTDQLRGALEGNATFTICEAVEIMDEERAEANSDWKVDRYRDYEAA